MTSFSKILSIPVSHISSDSPTTTALNHFPIHPPKSHLRCCSRFPSLFFPHTGGSCPFQVLASQNHHTFADWKDKCTKQKSELEEAFHSAESLDDMLKAFKDFEASCEEDHDLGVASAKLALKLYIDDEDPELILCFGKKASIILTPYENTSFSGEYSDLYVIILRNLLFSGIACSKLKRLSESLDYLNRASRIGARLAGDSYCCDGSILSNLCVIEKYLAIGKRAMGMAEEEIILHLRKCVEIQEKYVDGHDIDLGHNSQTLSHAYARVFDFKEALPFCLKALKIFTRHFGQDSVEVAQVRRFIGTIYGSLGDYDKAREQLHLSTSILKKNYDPSSHDLVEEEIRSATYQIILGRYEKALATLKAIVPHTIKDKELRAMAFLTMAQGYCHQGKFDDAKRCAEITGGSFAKKEDQVSFVGYVADMLRNLSIVYEKMNELETAMSYLERVLMMTGKVPLKLLSVVTARYYLLICSTGKAEEGIPYLEVAVQRLKEKFDSKHFQVGNAYSYLGSAYLMLLKPETAVEFFTDAKDIMDASVGPHHENSIKICQGLFRAYANMGSYPEAINIQEMVIERLKGKEPRAEDELDAAVRLLERIKEKAGH